MIFRWKYIHTQMLWDLKKIVLLQKSGIIELVKYNASIFNAYVNSLSIIVFKTISRFANIVYILRQCSTM